MRGVSRRELGNDNGDLLCQIVWIRECRSRELAAEIALEFFQLSDGLQYF